MFSTRDQVIYRVKHENKSDGALVPGHYNEGSKFNKILDPSPPWKFENEC